MLDGRARSQELSGIRGRLAACRPSSEHLLEAYLCRARAANTAVQLYRRSFSGLGSRPIGHVSTRAILVGGIGRQSKPKLSIRVLRSSSAIGDWKPSRGRRQCTRASRSPWHHRSRASSHATAKLRHRRARCTHADRAVHWGLKAPCHRAADLLSRHCFPALEGRGRRVSGIAPATPWLRHRHPRLARSARQERLLRPAQSRD